MNITLIAIVVSIIFSALILFLLSVNDVPIEIGKWQDMLKENFGVKECVTMPRYIDAGFFSQTVYENFGRDGEFDYRDLIRILGNQPTADVKEVVYGEWKYNRTVSGFACVVCSSCGHEAFATAKYVTDGIGCPFCLANMKKESNKQ